MPDEHGFDHLTTWGVQSHHCVECDFPGRMAVVSEEARRKHRAVHVRAAREEAERTRRKNLAMARSAKKQAARENAHAYRQEGDA